MKQNRSVYGLQPMGSEYLMPVIKGCKDEIISDIVVDKVIGNIPYIGLPANMIAAKAMTWRLGILFGRLTIHSRRWPPGILKITDVHCNIKIRISERGGAPGDEK